MRCARNANLMLRVRGTTGFRPVISTAIRTETTMAREPKTLDELFHDTLKDIYYAEKKILSSLPKMAKAAHSEDLTAAFEKHQEETEGQVERLEQVFELIEKKP